MDIKEEQKARDTHKKVVSIDLVLGKRTLQDCIETGDVLLQDIPKIQQGLQSYKRLKGNAEKSDLPATLPNPWNMNLPVHDDRK